MAAGQLVALATTVTAAALAAPAVSVAIGAAALASTILTTTIAGASECIAVAGAASVTTTSFPTSTVAAALFATAVPTLSFSATAAVSWRHHSARGAAFGRRGRHRRELRPGCLQVRPRCHGGCGAGGDLSHCHGRQCQRGCHDHDD